MNSEERTHENILNKYQASHHTGASILENIPWLNIISNISLEYMHLICLGVVKKRTVSWWLHG